MDHHRDTQLAAFGPDRIDPRVIHGNELAALVPVGQAKVLGDLEAPAAQADRLFQPFGLVFAEVRLIDPAEIRPEEKQEPLFSQPMQNADLLFVEVVPRIGIQADTLPDPGLVHFLEVMLGLAQVAQMVVNVDHRELGP